MHRGYMISEVILFTGLPSKERLRQETVLQRLLSKKVRTVFCERKQKINIPMLSHTTLVIFDTTWACHKTFHRVKSAAISTNAQILSGRFTPGTMERKISDLISITEIV